jgi:hypothetical protein
MSTQTKKDTTYNGWKNYQTWNVSLWINNDEGLYNSAVEYVRDRKKQNKKVVYKNFIEYMGLTGERTPDNISYSGSRLDYKSLSEMLNELS